MTYSGLAELDDTAGLEDTRSDASAIGQNMNRD